jgi:hypothetical protein
MVLQMNYYEQRGGGRRQLGNTSDLGMRNREPG